MLTEAHEDIWECFDQFVEGAKQDTDSNDSITEQDDISGLTKQKSSADDEEAVDNVMKLGETSSRPIVSPKLQLKCSSSKRTKINLQNIIEVEIDECLEEPLLPRQDNPMKWWGLKTKSIKK